MSKETPPSLKDIDDYVHKMMLERPVEFIQYALIAIGREIVKTGASDFTFSQNSDLEDGQRYAITIKGNIKKIKK